MVLQPAAGQSISRIVQSLTVAHTWHYHKSRGGVGHVWQGRFQSPVIQEDEHLLTVLRYVEANPLRAGMVSNLASYPWSSYVVHGLGKPAGLLDAVPGWLEVAENGGGTASPLAAVAAHAAERTRAGGCEAFGDERPSVWERDVGGEDGRAAGPEFVAPAERPAEEADGKMN